MTGTAHTSWKISIAFIFETKNINDNKVCVIITHDKKLSVKIKPSLFMRPESMELLKSRVGKGIDTVRPSVYPFTTGNT